MGFDVHPEGHLLIGYPGEDIASRRRELLDKIVAEHTGPGEIIALTLDHADKESIRAAVEEVSKRVSSLDL